VKLAVEDFEVIETERRTSATVALLVDLSYSMALRGTWGAAKATALALHSLVTTAYPQDKIEIIGFSNYARVISPTELAGLSWDMVQGTNLQHALMPPAGTWTGTDATGEWSSRRRLTAICPGTAPGAFGAAAGDARGTLAEVERCTWRGATINVFMFRRGAGRSVRRGVTAQRRAGVLAAAQTRRHVVATTSAPAAVAARRAG
jgi:uncharacterized protein with von Willebrand factor type A (vWA) domain